MLAHTPKDDFMRALKLCLLPLMIFAQPAKAELKGFLCEFTVGNFNAIQNGTLETSKIRNPLKLAFSNLDFKSNTALLIGNSGSSPVKLSYGSNLFHLTEITGNGGVTLTSIIIPAANKDKFNATHSRHLSSSKTGFISQYIGRCTAIEY